MTEGKYFSFNQCFKKYLNILQLLQFVEKKINNDVGFKELTIKHIHKKKLDVERKNSHLLYLSQLSPGQIRSESKTGAFPPNQLRWYHLKVKR